MHIRRAALCAVLGAPLAALTALAVTGPAAATPTAGRHALARPAPAWATATTDRGPVAAGTAVTAQVMLGSRDATGLAAFATAVSDPRGPDYQHYLSAAAVDARYGTSPAQLAAVTRWLRGTGLAVTGHTAHAITVRGDARAVGAAFGTSLHSYTHAGQTVRAPATAPSVPAALAGDVLAVNGLSTAPQRIRPANDLTAPGARATAAATSVPCSAYYGQRKATAYPTAYGHTAPYAICGYTPRQLRGAYGVTGSGLTGKGATVAVVDSFATTTILADANRWARNRGEPAFTPGQFTQNVPAGTAYDPGWGGEEALDVEAVHSMAPDAHVVYVAASNDSDISTTLDALNRIVDHHLADLVTNSWIWDTDADMAAADITTFEQIFQRGAAEGIGFYFSSGDGGGLDGSGTPYTFYPSDDPWATAVGGSAVAIDRQNHYRWETGWETDYSYLDAAGTGWSPTPPGPFTSGAGGGTSTVFAQPFYQRGVVPGGFSRANGATRAMRTIPDVAAVGDPTTGFLAGDSEPDATGALVYSEYRIGGTSLSSPLIAGMQALAQQAAHGKPVGFANPALYSRYGTPAFHDVTDHPRGPGTSEADVRTVTTDTGPVVALASLGRSTDAGLATVRGYDTTTGVGTPTRAYFDSFRHRR